MNLNVKNALHQCNRDLRKRALNNYWVLLKRVCQVHKDYEWAKQARKLLEFKLTTKTVSSLMDLADSLSSQKYDDARQHFWANQFSLLIRKYPFPDEINPFDPEKVAVRKFESSEHKCARVNSRFRARRRRKTKAWPKEYLFNEMRQFIAYAIGCEPDMQRIHDNGGFGPGASIGTHGNATNIARKLSGRWTVSPGAYLYGYAAACGDQCFRERMFSQPLGFSTGGKDYDPFKGPFSKIASIVAYNKIAFVPKTARTHRSIAVEPLLNGYLQKGVDCVLRLCLKRIGIDLADQSLNSEMARLGSLSGAQDSFVTIDLASASDSISVELVRELLPPEWFRFLDSIRSHHYKIYGEVRTFHKFCSMGNGFCFPLETLLFTAACKAVGCGKPGVDFRVYGDDIIVRRSKASQVLELLEYMGFTVNTDKTFLQGPFRESCGRDWFNGVDVRPYTLDFPLDSVQSLFKCLNGSQRNSFSEEFFSEIRPFLLSLIPASFRFFRPYPGPEDSAIDSRCDEFLTSPHVTYRFKNGSGSWRWKELISSSIPDREARNSFGGKSYALMYAALVGSASDVPFAIRRKTRTKVRFISHPGATSQWLPPAL